MKLFSRNTIVKIILVLIVVSLCLATYLNLWSSKSICETTKYSDLQLINGVKTCKFKSITERTRQEMHESGISDDLVDLNVVSIPDVVFDEHGTVLKRPIAEVLGLSNEYVSKLYPPNAEREGWTYLGIDPKSFAPSQTYEVKPIPPFRDLYGYPQKYEVNHSRVVVILPRISKRVSSLILNTKSEGGADWQEDRYFWQRVIESDRPIVIVEGFKKALSLISYGTVAISILGSCGGIVFEQSNLSLASSRIMTDLLPFLREKRRQIYINFDTDELPSVRRLVSVGAWVHAALIEREGNIVSIATLPEDTKGVDDFLVKYSITEYYKLLNDAIKPGDYSLQFSPTLSFLELTSVDWCARRCEGQCAADTAFKRIP